MSLAKSIGIVGAGVVGNATARCFVEHVDEVRLFDIDPMKRTHSLQDVARCEFVFICLPTPMHRDGSCDTSIVDNAVMELAVFRDTTDVPPTIVIRSTVPPGTTSRLAKAYPKMRLLHSPEFLTARCSVTDAHCPSRNIIGVPAVGAGPWQEFASGHGLLASFYQERFPSVPLYVMASDESELVKLACNAFFATKIAFFNEMKQISNGLHCDWERVLNGILSDGRIAHSHTQVPGPDGTLGFGGACLPKDLSSLIYVAKSVHVDPYVIGGAQFKNMQLQGGLL